MNKFEIIPQVMVYKNVLSDKDIDFLLAQIKKSENDIDGIEYARPEDSAYYDAHGSQPEERKDGSLIYTWTPWYTFGSRSIWGYCKDPYSKDSQYIGSKMIKDTLVKVHNDYCKQWSDSGRWTYSIKNWSLEEDYRIAEMTLSTFEILKHRINNETEYTIKPHTDWHEQRSEEPGPKQLLTYTMYLNDNYEGGEVDFVDEENKRLIIYKPQKGDITVFPSGAPFWHGAKAVTSGENKFFIRTFALHLYPGSEEWNLNARTYGVKKWYEMSNEKIKDYVDAGNVGRQLVFDENEIEEEANLVPLFIKEKVYIDGRDKSVPIVGNRILYGSKND